MKILVTGASGFLGTSFLEFIKESNISDDIILYTSKPITGYNCVLYDRGLQDKCILPEKIDILLCIGGFVPKTKADQCDGYKHALAVLNLHTLLQRLPNIPQRIVYCSSVEVYGRSISDVVTEQSELDPYDLYSSQKLMCEGIITEYARVHKCDYLILRLGPMFGKHDERKSCFLPGIIYRALNGEDIKLTVSQKTRRNYIYVKDVARLLWNSTQSKQNGIINVVSKNNLTLGEIAKIVVLQAKSCGHIISDSSSLGPELVYNNLKMETILGKEKYLFNDAIKETIQWINSMD